MSDATTPTRSDRIAGRTIAAMVACLLFASFPAATAAAQAGSGAPEAHGYWWRAPMPVLDVAVPEDGLVVAGQPEGPLAVSALRFTGIDPDEMAASIHLEVAQDTREGFVEEPLLFACPAERDWEPAQGGDWDDVPGTHCSPGTAAHGELGEDGEYVFVVSTFLQAGELDIVITPGVRGAVPSPLLLQLLNDQLIEMTDVGAPWPGPPTVDGLDGSNFMVTFEEPGGATLRTGSDSADESVTALDFDGSSEFGADFDDGEFGSDDFSGGDGFDGGEPETGDPLAMDTGGGDGGLTDSPAPRTADPPGGDGGDPGEVGAGEAIHDEPVTRDDGAVGEQADGGQPAETAAAGGIDLDPQTLGALVLAMGVLAAGALAMGSGRPGMAGLGGAHPDRGGLGPFARPRATKPPML